jgi:hypothetical protein
MSPCQSVSLSRFLVIEANQVVIKKPPTTYQRLFVFKNPVDLLFDVRLSGNVYFVRLSAISFVMLCAGSFFCNSWIQPTQLRNTQNLKPISAVAINPSSLISWPP